MFLLPIYSKTKEEFDQWLVDEVNADLVDVEKEIGVAVSQSMREYCIEAKREEYAVYWEFNRAVGWVSVKRAVGGFSFNVLVASNKKRPGVKKFFKPLPLEKQPNQGKFIPFNSEVNPEMILARFKEVFDNITKSNACFKGCYIEILPIKEISSFIDWKVLIETKF